jgi:hypothetical protein
MRPTVNLDMPSGRPQGQILVLVAVMLVVLIGIAGLAIDISSAYLTERGLRAVADAASLAGAQDLQIPGSRALPTSTEQGEAREHALDVLESQLKASSRPSGASCFSSAGCSVPGTDYEIAIQTPSPTHLDCFPAARCIQVTIRQPSFGLTFGRIFDFSEWTVTSASVAGVVQAQQYGVVTLRPPKPRGMSGSDANEDNIFVSGGSRVVVNDADIGTNTNLRVEGTGSAVILDPDYAVHHYDPYERWTPPPPGFQLTSLIEDPLYSIPDRADVPGLPSYSASDLADAKLDPAACALEQDDVPAAYELGGIPVKDLPPANITCYKPGVYTSELQSGTDEVVLLTTDPVWGGVYFFDQGMDLGNPSALIGGYEGGQPGVALVFQECDVSNDCPLKGNTADLIALNFGNTYPAASNAQPAEWNGGSVQTSATPPLLMSLMVVPDPICYVAPEEPAGHCSTHNQTLTLPGGGSLFVAGVQYAPTDNAVVTGGSGSGGVLGQIISWTIRFTGSSELNLQAALGSKEGVLRLDRACSPTHVCNP